MLPVKNEPVLTGVLARVVLMLAGRFGFDLSLEELMILMSAGELLIAIIVRNRVTPIHKAEEKIKQAAAFHSLRNS